MTVDTAALLPAAQAIVSEFTDADICRTEVLAELDRLLFGRKEIWAGYTLGLITQQETLAVLIANLVSFALQHEEHRPRNQCPNAETVEWFRRELFRGEGQRFLH